jgi:molecular chaperone GrpE
MTDEIQNTSSEEVKDPELNPEELKAQSDEYLSGWQRCRADFSNYRRDEAERLENTIRFANEDLIKDLAVTLGSFDLALQAMEKEGKIDQGVQMIRNSLLDALAKRGLEKITIMPEEDYDPALAEIIAIVPSDQKENTVVEVVEVGYKLHGKVIRPARVKVSKGK